MCVRCATIVLSDECPYLSHFILIMYLIAIIHFIGTFGFMYKLSISEKEMEIEYVVMEYHSFGLHVPNAQQTHLLTALFEN